RGRGAHVFNDDVDLEELERQVWAQGSYQGRIGQPPRSEFERFVWRSPTPIGRRIQRGKPDLPLHWVEVMGKLERGRWVLHLAPRTRPAAYPAGRCHEGRAVV